MISWIVITLIIAFSLIGSVVPFLFSILPYRPKADKRYSPRVSVIIPSKNERKIIGKVIESWLAVDYPHDKIEIICADNSTDDTPGIIKMYARRHRRVKYRRGSGGSKLIDVLGAMKGARNPVVMISDSDVIVSPSCVRECLKYMNNEKVGAVFGKRTPINYRKGIFSRWDAFRLLKTFVPHRFFTKVDSAVYFSASPCAIKRECLKGIKPEEKLIADDLYIALHVRKAGLKVVFNPSVEGKVGVLERMGELFVRNPRSEKGTAQIALKGYEGTLFNREYGRFGMFIIPYIVSIYLANAILYPLLLLTLAWDLIISAVQNALPGFAINLAGIFLAWYIVMLLGSFLFLLVIFLVIKHRDLSFLLMILLDPFFYLISMSSILTGFYSHLLGRKVEWKKTESDRNV